MLMTMTPERWQQIQKLLDEALELPEDELQGFLDALPEEDLRREVLSMVRAVRTDDGRLDEAPDLGALVDGTAGATTPDDPGSDEQAPDAVGPYRLLELLGEGGMGSVHLAERTDGVHHKKVALKLLRGSFIHPELQQRFRAEREILAHLDHPNIARLLDGGATADGRPYLVLEHVEGQRIDRYADAQKLTVNERLKLFRKVCDAVQYAHQNLVVHRDLKPGNILVTPQGEPKLLDFGIAKLLEPGAMPMTLFVTHGGRGPMTPAYASPEQLKGQPISTASDVFALGVMLYELLSGRRPFESSGDFDAMVQLMTGVEPERPSSIVTRPTASQPHTPASPLDTTQTLRDAAAETPAQPSMEQGSPRLSPKTSGAETIAAARQCDPARLRRQLRGDLDSIVLEALAFDPHNRYASAEQLGQDLDRYFQGLPIQAREATFGYRTRKFVRRNRWGLATAAGIGLLVVVFIASLLVERTRTEVQSRRAGITADFLTNLFTGADPMYSPSKNLTARDLLDRGVATIDQQLEDEPEVRANLLATMGRSYLSLAEFDRSRELVDRALGLQRQLHGNTPHPDLAESLLRSCETYERLGQLDPAEAQCREALDIHRRLASTPTRESLEAASMLGQVLRRQRHLEEAAELLGQVVQQSREIATPWALGDALNSLAAVRVEQEDWDAAEALYNESLEHLDAVPNGEPLAALILSNRGKLRTRVGRYDLARQDLETALALQRSHYDGPHYLIARTRFRQGLLEEEERRFEVAEGSYLEALEIYRDQLDPWNPDIAAALARLAVVHKASSRLDTAESYALEALEIQRHSIPDSPATVTTMDFLAQIFSAQRRLDEAESLYAEVLEHRRRNRGNVDRLTAAALNNYATFLRDSDRAERSVPLYQEALGVNIEVYGPSHRKVGTVAFNLGRALHLLERFDEAEEAYRQALEVFGAETEDPHPLSTFIAQQYAELCNGQERFDEAETMARLALGIAAQKLPLDHDWALMASVQLGRSLLGLGDSAAAAQELQSTYVKMSETWGPDDPWTQQVERLLAKARKARTSPAEPST